MSNDPDILTLREAMSADDADEFQKGMVQEFNDHCDHTHWVFVLRSSLLQGTKVLPSVWAMWCKQRIATGVVYKWKARLNIHGRKQVKGIHYWDRTYLFPNGQVVLHQAGLGSVHSTRVVHSPDGLCTGISPSRH